MKFRTDINGLRALAVIAVVLFHFNPSWVPGGFAGVDVFFVISGFLMTGIIFRGLENNNFSIINFYVARANRIIPALSVVCLALLVFGWFYLTPLDYRALGKHVASSMGFLSNVIYWRESGYFDTASHGKWLLHTWSLSVEWQFYMIYPVVLVLLKKCMSLTNIKRLLVVGTVIGFIFSAYATYRWPNPAYFLLPTRAWEMMMGGLAFLYPLQNLKETSKKYLEWVGIALILASYAFISKDNLWPGYLALIPVLGAYLVIIANRSGSVITDNIVMQKVGLWSYSIYLWHWPVVVFGYYFEMQHWEWIGIPVSVVLGFGSYKFVESIKFPALSSISFKSIVLFKPLWMTFILIFLSVHNYINLGYIMRLDGIKQKLAYSAIKSNNDWDYRVSQPNISVGGVQLRKINAYKPSNKNILVIGASHAEQIYPYFMDKKLDYNVYFLTKGGCLAIPSFEPKVYDQCDNLKKYIELLKVIRFDKIITTFYGFNFGLDSKINKKQLNEIDVRIHEYDEFLKNLKGNAKDVYLILGEPKGIEFDPAYAVRNNSGSYVDAKIIKSEYYSIHNYALDKFENLENIHILDPIYRLCLDGKCYTRSSKGEFYYRDATHMRPWYAKSHLSYLDEILKS